MRRIASVVAALSLLGGLFVAPALAAPSRVDCSAQYVVEPGDNLFSIGVTFGVLWPQIATANNLSNPSLIFPGQLLCIPAGAGTPTALPAVTSTLAPTATVAPTAMPAPAVVVPVVPNFSIVSVVKDTSVTIQTGSFPSNQDFNVTMGPFGGLGVGGTSVDTTNSGAGGVFTATYNIPSQLAGMQQIAIRLQSASGYYAFNWFWNVTAP